MDFLIMSHIIVFFLLLFVVSCMNWVLNQRGKNSWMIYFPLCRKEVSYSVKF